MAGTWQVAQGVLATWCGSYNRRGLWWHGVGRPQGCGGLPVRQIHGSWAGPAAVKTGLNSGVNLSVGGSGHGEDWSQF